MIEGALSSYVTSWKLSIQSNPFEKYNWWFTNLHSNNSVDEEKHDDKQRDVRQSLKGLDEGPEKSTNTFAPTQKLHQSHDTKETEKVDRDDACRLCWAAAGMFRLINLGINDVDETSENDDEVENIPSVTKVILEPKSGKLEYKFKSENSSENHVEHVESVGVELRLSVEFHRKCDCVYHNQNKDCILKRLWRNKPPHFVLNAMFRDVSGNETRRNFNDEEFFFLKIFSRWVSNEWEKY